MGKQALSPVAIYCGAARTVKAILHVWTRKPGPGFAEAEREPAGLLGRIPAARWLRCTCASAVGSQLCPEWGCAVSPSLPSLRNGRRASSAAFLVWVSWSIRWHRARGALQRGPGVQPAAQCNVHSSLCMLASPADQLRVVGASTRCKTWGGGGPRDGQCPRKHLPKIVYCARCRLNVYRSNRARCFHS